MGHPVRVMIEPYLRLLVPKGEGVRPARVAMSQNPYRKIRSAKNRRPRDGNTRRLRVKGMRMTKQRQPEHEEQENAMKRNAALTSLFAVAAMVGATLSTTVEAQSRGPGMGAMAGGFDFAAADADSDGKVTAEELQSWRAARAAALDADGDGRISADELVAAQMRAAEARATARAERMIARFDTDGDGLITAAELLAGGDRLAAMFDRIDRDEDGALTEEDLQKMQHRMMQRHDRARGEHRARAHREGGHREKGAHHRGWDKRGDRAERAGAADEAAPATAPEAENGATED